MFASYNHTKLMSSGEIIVSCPLSENS